METGSASRLEVHYTLERADAKAFATHVYRTVPRLRFFVLRQSLILPVAGFIALWINNVPMQIAIPITLTLGLSSYFLIMLYLIWWTVRRLCEVRGWLGNHFLALELDFDRAFVIPKRAFASEQEAQQFLQTARLYWQTARGSGNQRVNSEDR